MALDETSGSFPASEDERERNMLGVNLSGAEFGSGNKYGWDYIYPSTSDLKFYADQGITLFRLPVRWERLQSSAGGELNKAEVARLLTFLDKAAEVGGKVIIDLHNYGSHSGVKLGSAGLPTTALADFWGKLAAVVGSKSAVYGYDLMNEPNGMKDPMTWPTAAQQAVNAIRAKGDTHKIYVEGEHWAGASNWAANNPYLDVKDPLKKIVYEAHVYFDRDGSGTYKGSYDAEGASPDIGAKRLQSFLSWLDKKDAEGFIGEFAVPSDDPRWQVALDNMLTVMNKAGLDGTYWGAGSWFKGYKPGLIDATGAAKASLDTLLKHVAQSEIADRAAEQAHSWPDAAPLDGPGTIDGSSARAETLTGADHHNAFYFATAKATTGNDRITNFGKHDILVVDDALYDGNKDGIIGLVSNVLSIDSPRVGDMLRIDGVAGLRYLGKQDGVFVYGDQAVRPVKAIEGSLGNDILKGDAGDKTSQTFFFDTALDLDLGNDKISNFGSRDILVTTSELLDGNSDGKIVFSAARGLGLTGANDAPDDVAFAGEAGTLWITDKKGKSVTSLEYDGQVQHHGVDYFVYSLAKSAIGVSALDFG